MVNGPTRPRYLPEDWILPVVDEVNREFFTSGELRLERCERCGHLQHPPSGVCIACGALDTGRVTVAAEGIVDSVTVVHHRLNPALGEVVPYNVVVVALAAQPHVRLVGNVLDAGDGGPAIGDAVSGVWTEPLGEQGVRLLQWVRAADRR